MSEAELIEKAIEGDYEAFDNLVKPYLNQAYQTAYLLLKDYNLSEDAVQEALYQTYLSLKRYDSSQALFTTWFNRIVINCTLKLTRKKRFFFEFKEEQYKETELSPEKKFEIQEEHKEIYDAIHKLNKKLQVVIILFYFQELSIKEISEVLNIKEGTVKSRLFKAREKLKEILSNKNI